MSDVTRLLMERVALSDLAAQLRQKIERQDIVDPELQKALEALYADEDRKTQEIDFARRKALYGTGELH
jgi:hypothetical protein